MSSEILSVLEYMEKEKGIPRVDMIATIANALKTAAQKGVNSGQELKIEINPKNGQLHAWSVLKVVDSVSVEGGSPTLDSMYIISFVKQKLGQVRAVLSGNASNECCLCHTF